MQTRNPSIHEDMNRIFDFKAGDATDDVYEQIIPVMPISRICKQVKIGSRATTGTATAFTTPTDKDFYIAMAELALIKDATNDAATGTMTLSATIEGVSSKILVIPLLTLTAQSETVVGTFTPPLKVDRGTSVTTSLTFSVGAASFACIIVGYNVETTKGT